VPALKGFAVPESRYFELPKADRPQNFDSYDEWFDQLSPSSRVLILTTLNKKLASDTRKLAICTQFDPELDTEDESLDKPFSNARG
jgi:hypothetical protein